MSAPTIVPMVARYGIRLASGRVVTDPDWACPADVMASTHGHDEHGPVDVVYRPEHAAPWVSLT